MFLGIDQSIRSTGICITDKEGTIIHHELIKNQPMKEVLLELSEVYDTKGEVIPNQFVEIHMMTNTIKRIQTICITNDVETVTIEGLALGIKNGDVSRQLAALQYLLLQSLYTMFHWSLVNIVTPTSLKLYATGGGKASKEGMFDSLPPSEKEIISTYLKSKGRYDVTDAYWLSIFGAKLYEKGHDGGSA